MSEIVTVADAYWSQDLGIPPDAFAGRRGVCCSPQDLYYGVQLFRRNDLLVLACPPEMVLSLGTAIVGLSQDQIFSAGWLDEFCGDRAEKILGPAEVYYADASTFQCPVGSAGLSGRALSLEDTAAYAALASSLDPEEAEASGLSSGHFPAFGVFADRILAAAASYSIWEPSIAHIVVATHPGYRRRGLAAAAVRWLAEDALGRGLILQWRALSRNTNSLAMAERLGFVHYCSTVYARLKPLTHPAQGIE